MAETLTCEMSLGRLRRQISVDESGQKSDTIYVTGVPKDALVEEVQKLFSELHPVVDFEWDQRLNKYWVKYVGVNEATDAVVKLHHRLFHRSFLNVRFELGVDFNGKPIVSNASHNTVVRQIIGKTSENDLKEVYSNRHIEVCGQLFPIPTGMYLSRMINVVKSLDRKDPLLELFTKDCLKGSNYSKEITEAMAMVDCTERAVKLVLNQSPEQLEYVDVFVLGDGKHPLCAGCMLTQFPTSWVFHSIDPLLQVQHVAPETGIAAHILDNKQPIYHERLHLFKGMSQDFPIENRIRSLTKVVIVIACHSHAPLQEFWNRLPSDQVRIGITMPCCSDYSELHHQDLVFEFDDFEVYSPKRRIRVYVSLSKS
uniref:RRM domain-containing protein n=1 Tax=Aplanochytrium stocchinoi TaxID=215587 RepID=A0A7S3PR92_9STRA|mmetsp:Transcript_31750/g.39165  ORF Transcript_31750/g.39165 Transcript_31750/m.39165 type:complete len:369 (+) Transcript_31750:128-1234(+)